MRLSRWWTSLAIAAAAFVYLVAPAQADLISSIDGTIVPPPPSGVDVTPGGPPGAVGNTVSEILRGPSTLFNGAPIPGGNVPTLIISTQTINSVAVDGTVTTYTLSTDPQDTSFKELLFNAPQGGGATVFDPVFTEAVVDSVSPDMLLLRGTETVSFDSNPMFDFSPLEGGFITATLDAPGTDFNAFLSADNFQSVSVEGVFSQFTVVPEPASIAIWLLFGFALTGFGYHRFRRKK